MIYGAFVWAATEKPPLVGTYEFPMVWKCQVCGLLEGYYVCYMETTDPLEFSRCDEKRNRCYCDRHTPKKRR